MSDVSPTPGTPGPPGEDAAGAKPRLRTGSGPRGLDGVSSFMGMRWDDPQTVRLQIRPELINGGGLLSRAVTYPPIDYCIGSTLWVQTTQEERIATIKISIKYLQTAIDGGIVCRTALGPRNRTIGSNKS